MPDCSVGGAASRPIAVPNTNSGRPRRAPERTIPELVFVPGVGDRAKFTSERDRFDGGSLDGDADGIIGGREVGDLHAAAFRECVGCSHDVGTHLMIAQG